VLHEGMVPAGAVSCAFRAEAHALRAAVTWVLDVARGQIARESDRPSVRFVLDGRGVLSALSIGPLSQRQHLLVEIWKLLGELLRYADVRLIFVFGHSDVPRHDHVDRLASVALQRFGRDPVPLSVGDCVNARMRNVCKYVGVPQLHPFRTTHARGTTVLPRAPDRVRAPDCSVDALDLCRRDEVLLLQMRSGCCIALGSIFHETTTPCRLCTRIVMCRAAAVTHIFTCESERAMQFRARHGDSLHSPDALWTTPLLALEYARLFMQEDVPLEAPVATKDAMAALADDDIDAEGDVDADESGFEPSLVVEAHNDPNM
jgi:hypothetical protein